MSVFRTGSDLLLGQPVLKFGEAIVNCEPIVRVFRVMNNGSKPAKLKWIVKQVLPSNTNGPLKLSLNFREQAINNSKSSKKLTLSLNWWEDILQDAPFTIEPNKAIIPSYDKQTFKVIINVFTIICVYSLIF
jgi:hypothetical protein